MAFAPPIDEIAFTMRRMVGFDPAAVGDLGDDTIAAVLGEAGRFATDVLAPLNRIGDRDGIRLGDGAVTTAPGWKEAYGRWVNAGWNGLAAPEAWGGQNLPVTVKAAVDELWNAAAVAFAAGPTLTAGAIEAIEAHADTAIKSLYLEALVSGRWMATMNLTEPQAGSDLNALTTRAEPGRDGAYRISGQKVFITYGEHDLTENIIHLVLARLPDAPPGTMGVSLFLVPKFLVNSDGSLGRRNGVRCVGIERKLGLHAAPTCTMVYDGADGWLIGERNRGLACMFTMMNTARLDIGIQGVGVAERAYQQAHAYACERRQGRAPGWNDDGMSPIVMHPDVQAMLLRMKALVMASRALCQACARAIDLSRRGPEPERSAWAERTSLLTPIAKAFATDAANEVTSLAIQVHGGAGYIEETGAAQHFRDARVFAIYEGTNGIQAIDLVTRKLALADGAVARRQIDELSAVADAIAASNRIGLGRIGDSLSAAVSNLADATDFMLVALGEEQRADVLAGASAYLRLFALTAAGSLLAAGALRAEDGEDRFVAIARYFAETLLEESSALATTVTMAGPAHKQAAAAWLDNGHDRP